MSWYAIDAVDRAFSRTRKALFEPFDFWKWIKLAIIILLLGGIGSSYGGSGTNYRMGPEDFNNNFPNIEPGRMPVFPFGSDEIGLGYIQSVSPSAIIIAAIVFILLLSFDFFIHFQCHGICSCGIPGKERSEILELFTKVPGKGILSFAGAFSPGACISRALRNSCTASYSGYPQKALGFCLACGGGRNFLDCWCNYCADPGWSCNKFFFKPCNPSIHLPENRDSFGFRTCFCEFQEKLAGNCGLLVYQVLAWDRNSHPYSFSFRNGDADSGAGFPCY